MKKNNYFLNSPFNLRKLFDKDELIGLSKSSPYVLGIVGWTDLKSENLNTNLKRIKRESNGKFIGLRHIVSDDFFKWVSDPNVELGLQALQDNDLTFDVICYNKNQIEGITLSDLRAVPKMSTKFPNLRIVINHMIRTHFNRHQVNEEEWIEGIRKAAEYPNVFIKLYIFKL